MQVFPDCLFEPRRLGAHVAPGSQNVTRDADAGERGGFQWAAIQPEKRSLTAKDAKHAKKDPVIPGVPESRRLSSPDDFRPWSEAGSSEPGSLCALCELGGEIFRFNPAQSTDHAESVDFVQSHDAANGDDAKYIRGVA